MSSPQHKQIFDQFEENTIAYNPQLARLLGTPEAALLLGNFLFWQGMGHKKDWTYKTIPELEAELGLTRARQISAITLCKKLGVLEVRLKGIPARRHFRVDVEKLYELVSSLPKTGKLAGQKRASRRAQNKPTNSEINQKLTTEKGRREYFAKKAELAKFKTF